MANFESLERPIVVTSLDGSRAVAFVDLWERRGTRLTLRGRSSPGGPNVLFTVDLGFRLLHPQAAAGLGLSTTDPDKTRQLVELAAGTALDDPAFPLEVEAGSRAPDFTAGLERFVSEVRQQTASPEAAALYIGAKLYWGWSYGLATVPLDAADALRLGTQGEEEIRRLAMIGEGAYWDRIDGPTSPTLYRPTGLLLREFQAGRFPGLVTTPIAQVGRLLEAPRYAAARVAFEKATEFLAGDRQDLENAVKEAASAVESLGRVVLELKGKVTLGTVGAELQQRGVLERPLDKAVDALSGFRGGEPGVGHGGESEPDVTTQEAQFAINLAASLALLLLDLDQRGASKR